MLRICSKTLLSMLCVIYEVLAQVHQYKSMFMEGAAEEKVDCCSVMIRGLWHPSCGHYRCLTLAAWRPKSHDGGEPDVLHCLVHSHLLMAPQGDYPLDGCTQRLLAVQVSQQCLQPGKAALPATRAGQL